MFLEKSYVRNILIVWQAVQDIGKACKICAQDPKLSTMVKPVVHSLLGLYGMSMNLMAEAEEQFKKAIR